MLDKNGNPHLPSDFIESLHDRRGKVAFIPDLRKRRIERAAAFFMQEGWFLRSYDFEKNRISSIFSRQLSHPAQDSSPHALSNALAAATQHLAFIYLSECHGFDHSRVERIKFGPWEDALDPIPLFSFEENIPISVQVHSIRPCRRNMYAVEMMASIHKDIHIPSSFAYFVVD